MTRLAHTLLSLTLALSATIMAWADSIVPSDAPNQTQRLMSQRGYGMFIHFGMNTFIQQEWSDGTAPASAYCPTALDCDQWVRTARDAGFRYVLLVTKHHDGFCLWPSQWTDYDVASSPVPTDILAEVSTACRRYGLGFAVYYSLWDRHEPSYRDPDFSRYVEYMERQLTEIMTNYGEVCELWFDGGWDKPEAEWQMPRLYSLVKSLQPNCAISTNGNVTDTAAPDGGGFVHVLPDLTTVDNRYYLRYFPGDFRLWDPKIASKKDAKQYLHDGKSYYLPFEHTICLSKEWCWFQKADIKEVRELDELEELFYWATDNGNTLVINVAPDATGRIREHEANAVVALAQRLGLRRDAPLPRGGDCISLDCPAEASSTWHGEADFAPDKAVDGGMQTRWASCDGDSTAQLVVTLDPAQPFNKITIFEYCDVTNLGDFANKRINRIQAYTIDIYADGRWTAIYASDLPMFDCKVVRLPRCYRAERVRLNVTRASAPPSIYEFNVIYDPHLATL